MDVLVRWVMPPSSSFLPHPGTAPHPHRGGRAEAAPHGSVWAVRDTGKLLYVKCSENTQLQKGNPWATQRRAPAAFPIVLPKEHLFSLCFTAPVVLQICVLPVSTLARLLGLDPLKWWGETRFLGVFDLKDREILFELKGFQREDKNCQASPPPGFGK